MSDDLTFCWVLRNERCKSFFELGMKLILKAKKSLLCWMLISKISPYLSKFWKKLIGHGTWWKVSLLVLDVQNINHSTYSYFLCQLLYLYYLCPSCFSLSTWKQTWGILSTKDQAYTPIIVQLYRSITWQSTKDQ